MADKSLDRWLLINYSGYPYAPNSFLPDNGLAGLAGVLQQKGKEVLILDYCTVSTLEHFSSASLQSRLRSAWNGVRSPETGVRASLRRLGSLARLRISDRERKALRVRFETKAASEILEFVRKRGIDAIGFKLWNGDGLEGALRMARLIRKEKPHLRIIGGGPQVDIFMQRLLGVCDCFDALAFGEGEDTIRMLSESGADPASYASIPNLLFQRDGQIVQTETRPVADLGSLPLPVYDPEIYPAMRNNEKIRILVIDESRGCRNGCAFCIHPIKSNRSLRTKDPRRLVDEIETMIARHGIRTFRFAGSCTPYGELETFASELCRRNLDVRYTAFAHVRGSETANFELLRQSGCLSLFFGLESGSQKVLDKMRKGVKASAIPTAIRRAKDAGIFTVGSLIYPAPGDTEETEEETLTLLRPNKPDAIAAQSPIVGPRIAWFETPGDFGIHFDDREAYAQAAMRWKLNLLLPPAFWKPLPVRIDGQSSRQVLARTARFVKRLEAEGFMTSVSDDTYLMSVRAEMEVSDFRDQARLAFFTGDAAAARRLVARINAAV
jgi:radical SAM superfamily enzyme YgiQ (UPF0313 family)